MYFWWFEFCLKNGTNWLWEETSNSCGSLLFLEIYFFDYDDEMRPNSIDPLKFQFMMYSYATLLCTHTVYVEDVLCIEYGQIS